MQSTGNGYSMYTKKYKKKIQNENKKIIYAYKR